MSTPIRVLQIVSFLSKREGVTSVLCNWSRGIDKTKVLFDYLMFMPNISSSFPQELTQHGEQVFVLPNPMKSPLQFLKESYKFFKTHRYHTIHSHVTHLNFIFYPLAKMFGTKNILQHAHGTKWSDKKLTGIRNYILFHLACPWITHKIGCSRAAAEAYFGKNFSVVNNGVDVEKFTYDEHTRTQKRKELGIENNFVIGHVGRFHLQKNHLFLFDIFTEVSKKDPSAKLVLAGIGPLLTKMQNLAQTRNLQGRVLFLKGRTDVAELYQAFDVLCMPSLYEGLPVVGVEAQASGLPGVFADTITPEVLLLPSSKMLSLKDSPAKWAEEILALKNMPRTSGADALRAKGFDIRQTARQIQDFYLELEK